MLKHHSRADHEQLFLERYSRLTAAAVRLTSGQRDRAEELIQEAFIQFTLTTPNLEGIQNLDAYLHGVLRKLHLSHARRAARAMEVSLAAVDYDSMELSLSQADARAHRHVLSELAAVCAYACQRKRSSKAASVLILRFFHGYYPDEIARVLRIDVRAVDEWRRIARREAKAAISAQAVPSAHLPADGIADLRAAIFGSCDGPCLTPAQLAAYGAPPLRQRIGKVLPLRGQASRVKSDVDCAGAAHIVSCERCLNEISRRLRIPTLSERSAEDNLGPGTRQDPPPPSGPPARRSLGEGGGAAPAADAVRRARRRGRHTFEHKPDQLHVAVNGLPLTWQSIGSEPIDQHVNVTTHEAIEFIEVFSEQGVRLLFLNARPPADDVPVQGVEVALSGNRTLGVELSYAGTWPSIHLTYTDPSGVAVAPNPEPATEEVSTSVLGTHDLSDRPGHRRRWGFAFVVVLALVVFAVAAAASSRSMVLQGLRYLDRAVHEWLDGARTVGLVDARATASLASLAETKAPVASALTRRRLEPAGSGGHTFADLVALEVDVLRRLDGIGALLGERISVSRDDQRVLVDAIAESQARKTEIATALGPLMTTPGLRVTVSSVAERVRSAGPVARDKVTIREVRVAHDAIPAWEAVQNHLRSRGEPDSTLPDRVRDFASRIVRRSDEALVQTWAIQRLASRFTADEQQALSDQTYAAWWGLVVGHARQLREATASLRQDLQNVFAPTPGETEAPSDVDPNGEMAIHDVVDRLAVLVSAYDRAIRAMFTAQEESAGGGDAIAVDMAVLRSMHEVEGLADWLARHTRP